MTIRAAPCSTRNCRRHRRRDRHQSAIADAYPAHGIIGEEFGASRPEADYCWIIDPIDGTRAFILGLPLWGTLIGLISNGAPLLGLMNQPFTGERFWSGETQSYFRHAAGIEQTIRTRSLRELSARRCSSPRAPICSRPKRSGRASPRSNAPYG